MGGLLIDQVLLLKCWQEYFGLAECLTHLISLGGIVLGDRCKLEFDHVLRDALFTVKSLSVRSCSECSFAVDGSSEGRRQQD